MSDQLAFDFTLPALQQAPAVQLSSLSTSESTAPKEDKFIYGGGSAKEAKFFKMFDQLAAESQQAFTAARFARLGFPNRKTVLFMLPRLKHTNRSKRL